MVKDYNKVFIGSMIACIVTLVIIYHVTVPCVIYTLTGFYCPGCGTTRAILSILKGQLYQAFRYNSIVFIDIPIILLVGFFEKIFGRKNNILKYVSNIVLFILLSITIIYGVLRNIPSFSYLAPTVIR